MTTQMNYDPLIPSLFDTTIEAFKSGSREVGNNILMNIIFYFKETEQEYKQMSLDLEANPRYSLELDTERFHDGMLGMEDLLENSLEKAKEHKHESEILEQYYKAIQSLYEIVLSIGMEVSTISAHIKHEDTKLAS